MTVAKDDQEVIDKTHVQSSSLQRRPGKSYLIEKPRACIYVQQCT